MNKFSKAASILSARGASKGGTARAASLTSNQRKQIASAAAQARWSGLPQIEQNPSDECDDPKCPCKRFRKLPLDPLGQCILNKPLWMVIPPDGFHLPCPIHGKHFIIGIRVFC